MARTKAMVAFKKQEGLCAFCAAHMQPKAWAYTLIVPEEIGGSEDGPGVACCSSCLALKGIGDGLAMLQTEPHWEFTKARNEAMRVTLHHPVAVPHSGGLSRVKAALSERWKHPRFVCEVTQGEADWVWVKWPQQPGCGLIKALLGANGGGRMEAEKFSEMKPWLIEQNVWIQDGSVVSSDWRALRKPKNERKTFTETDRKRYLESLRKPDLTDEEHRAARIVYLKAKLRQ